MATRLSRSGELILIPPQIPNYLSAVHDLKPIVGRPSDDEVKAVHVVIRAMDAVAHLPTFHDPDLSAQLSQHLFGAQMAVYRASYSMNLLPGDQNVYTPPTLPSHIASTLGQVVGVPSNEEIKSARGALRSLDGLAIYPQLFDADLSMKLSQHVFNLQFARYMHNSSEGQFMSENELEGTRIAELQPTGAAPAGADTSHEAINLEGGEQSDASLSEAERDYQPPSGPSQLGETMKDVRGILENMNRILTLIKRDQSMVGCIDKYYQVYKNPLNRQGIAASEYGLPQLRYEYIDNGYHYKLWMRPKEIARYLQFFDIGAELIQDGAEPGIIEGKLGEAEKLLLAQAGIAPTSGQSWT